MGMRLLVTVKQIGKRKDVLTQRNLNVDNPCSTLRDLLTEIVLHSVQEFNKKPVDAELVATLTNSDIQSQAQVGKVGFFRKSSTKKADPQDAIKNALQCFEDGLYRVFINDEEVTQLSQTLHLCDGDSLVFIRMTMLAGRMW